MSLMGIYGGDMIFPSTPPISLLKWGAVIWLITDIDDVPAKIKIRVLMPPDRTEIASLETNEPPEIGILDDATKGTFRVIMALPPVNFTEEGFVEVVVETERGTIRAGRLLVKFPPPQSAPLPVATPSESDGRPVPSQSAAAFPKPSSPPAPSRRARPTRRPRS
jgi:hypothetical protein